MGGQKVLVGKEGTAKEDLEETGGGGKLVEMGFKGFKANTNKRLILEGIYQEKCENVKLVWTKISCSVIKEEQGNKEEREGGEQVEEKNGGKDSESEQIRGETPPRKVKNTPISPKTPSTSFSEVM